MDASIIPGTPLDDRHEVALSAFPLAL
jgi:hypothetical protein